MEAADREADAEDTDITRAITKMRKVSKSVIIATKTESTFITRETTKRKASSKALTTTNTEEEEVVIEDAHATKNTETVKEATMKPTPVKDSKGLPKNNLQRLTNITTTSLERARSEDRDAAEEDTEEADPKERETRRLTVKATSPEERTEEEAKVTEEGTSPETKTVLPKVLTNEKLTFIFD